MQGFGNTKGICGREEEQFKDGKGKLQLEYRDDEYQGKAPGFTQSL